MDSFNQLTTINQGLSAAFPTGDNIFQIMTRLLEECGELAEQVHIFEDSGVKRKKHGAPNKQKLAKEIQDVLRCALQVATHYAVIDELKQSISSSQQKLIADGWLPQNEQQE